jgi:hypothetical protein
MWMGGWTKEDEEMWMGGREGYQEGYAGGRM